jgi:pimeloyl-ACP methyl ester carboxylesterase
VSEPASEPTSQRPGGRAADAVRMVAVGRQRLRVAVRRGTGDGPPLLLCSGIGVALELWAPFVAALDPALSVVRFDVPGVGGSPLGRWPYPFPALARLAGGMLDQLDIGRFDVLGVSWGAARSPSSWPSRTRDAAGGSCSSPPRPGC